MNVTIDRIAPVFAVADLKAAIGWYRTALAFETSYINRDDGDESGVSWTYALLDNNDAQIHLCRIVPDDKTLSTPSNSYVFVSDIESLHEHLTALGVDVSDLQEMPLGALECWLHDPDGNRLVLSAAT